MESLETAPKKKRNSTRTPLVYKEYLKDIFPLCPDSSTHHRSSIACYILIESISISHVQTTSSTVPLIYYIPLILAPFCHILATDQTVAAGQSGLCGMARI